ncbi:hypothetical protein JCM11251_003483 [Rhodosporidiobolus azoricus]
MADIQSAPAPATRTLSPPRGAAFFGSVAAPPSAASTAADKTPSSRSPSRSRSPTHNLFQSITRSLSRSVSRNRSPEEKERQPRGMAGFSGPSRSRDASAAREEKEDKERQPRGMAGFSGPSRSREASASRGRAGAIQAEGNAGGRGSSLSRTRHALERVAEFVTPPSMAVSTAPEGSNAHGIVHHEEEEKGKAVEGRSASRGRLAGKENVAGGGRGESRSRSVGRQILAGMSHDRTA